MEDYKVKLLIFIAVCLYALLATFFIWLTNKDETEIEATDHLEDAAPEMYKLLETLSDFNCPLEYISESEFEAFCKIKDLLAKARGE